MRFLLLKLLLILAEHVPSVLLTVIAAVVALTPFIVLALRSFTVGEVPSASVCVSICCPKTIPKNDNPEAGAVVKVIVLEAMVKSFPGFCTTPPRETIILLELPGETLLPPT